MTTPIREITFRLHCFGEPRLVGQAELQAFAKNVGLAGVATARISSLLLMQMMAYAQIRHRP